LITGGDDATLHSSSYSQTMSFSCGAALQAAAPISSVLFEYPHVSDLGKWDCLAKMGFRNDSISIFIRVNPRLSAANFAFLRCSILGMGLFGN
jgi:hypothetical protein